MELAMRLRYRLRLGDAIRQIVVDGVTFDGAVEALCIPEADVAMFNDMLNSELVHLQVYNCARFRLTMAETQQWIDRGRPR